MAAVPEPDCDVLVCGLGPVGQLLALLLGRRGVPVIAIDRAEGVYDLPRAAVVDDEVLRIFQSAGVVEEILANSQIQEEVSFVTEAGRPQRILRPIDGVQGHPPLVSIHQPTIERTLVEALEEQDSVEMRWGCGLEGLTQTGGREPRVEALVRDSSDTGDGETETITARWAVGCDGGGSLVRQLLGIEFGGSTFRQRWLVVDVHVDRPLVRVEHPHFFGDWRRPIVSLPMSPGRHRWEWMIHPDEEDEPFLDPDSIDERIASWLEGETATVERACVYTFHDRLAARWRQGRVLLAGDAAHVMPPFAGQGFSSGARDAANLAWKLEAALAGAPEALLDSYERERRPHVQAMSRLAVSLGKFVQTSNRRVARIRDAYLNAMDRTGIAGWFQDNIKPVPAYGEGAFAEPPERLPWKRSVGSQFPQPLVLDADGQSVLLDEVAGPGWCAIATDSAAAEALGAEGLRVLLEGRDFSDAEGGVGQWLGRFGADWAVLRPDRFAFALGTGAEDARGALDEIHRQAGRTAAGAPSRVPVPA